MFLKLEKSPGSVARQRRFSRSPSGRIARRSAFISSSSITRPPASTYSLILFSNSAMPMATASRFLMGLR